MDFHCFEIIQYSRRHNKMGVRWCSLGSSRRHNLSIENPTTSRLHGDAFLYGFVYVLLVCVRNCVHPPYPIRNIFRAGHVRANIVPYAYLYGIKNHPSLKMHRPLHSRDVESLSQPRNVGDKAIRDQVIHITLFYRLPKFDFTLKENR